MDFNKTDFNKTLSSASTTAEHKDPSRAGVGTTAFGAALQRALHSVEKSPVSRDPVACALFGFTTRPKEVPFVLCVIVFLWTWFRPFFFVIKLFSRDFFQIADMVGMRTKFIDDNITEAVEKKGITQVVILGAGLDGRAARLPALSASSGVTVYEIDFKGMLDAKRNMFDQIGFGACYKDGSKTPVCVSTDLSEPPERWMGDLKAAGYDPKKPSFWLMEGVTGYLNQEELALCLGGVSSLACEGSSFCATWNGESAKHTPAPWTQSIHLSLIDNPDAVLAPLKWKREQHMSIGDATKVYGVNEHIAAADRSYWFSLHSMQ